MYEIVQTFSPPVAGAGQRVAQGPGPDYQKVVLTSFSEVEAQLATYAKVKEQITQAQAQRVAVAEALRIDHSRYREGYVSYLEELLAQRNLFAVEQAMLQLRAELLISEVSVYRALGGGWERNAGADDATKSSVAKAAMAHR